MYSNWHCWHKRQWLIFNVALNINIKNLMMFIYVASPKAENVEIHLCYKTLERHRPPTLTERESLWSWRHRVKKKSLTLPFKRLLPCCVFLHYRQNSSLKNRIFPWGLLIYYGSRSTLKVFCFIMMRQHLCFHTGNTSSKPTSSQYTWFTKPIARYKKLNTQAL